MLRAIAEQCLLLPPAQGVEEALEGLWLFHPLVILEGCVQDGENLHEATLLVVRHRLNQVLHLLPGRSLEGGQQVDGRFLLPLEDLHFLPIEGNASPLVPVVRGPAVEHRQIVVLHNLRLTAEDEGRRRTLLCRHSTPP